MSERVMSPCKDCTNRDFLCHSDCTSYKEYKGKIQAIKEGRANFLKERSIVVESVQRQIKHKNHSKKV